MWSTPGRIDLWKSYESGLSKKKIGLGVCPIAQHWQAVSLLAINYYELSTAAGVWWDDMRTELVVNTRSNVKTVAR